MKKNKIVLIILSCLAISLHAQEKKTYWGDGTLKSTSNYDRNGKKNGSWRKYYESGEVKEYKYYNHGEKSGTWNEYYYDGKKKSLTRYRDGLMYYTVIYYENGSTMVKGDFDTNEKRDGKWIQNYDNWQRKIEGDFSHGKKQGTWKHYTKTGKLHKIENYKEGVRISKWESNTKNSSSYATEEAVEVVEAAHGVEINAAADAVEETVIEDTVEVVEEAEIIESTVVVADAVEAVVDAAEDAGERNRYYSNRHDGEWKFYNKLGKIVEIGNYKSDKKDGKWTSYYDNGNIKKEQVWKKGKLMEVLSYMDEKGNILDKGTLKFGNGTVKEYNANNTLIATIKYISGEEIDWNDWSKLNSLAWYTYEDETNIELLQNAIKLVKRSIELDKNYYNTDTYAALLFKTGKYKQALTKAQEAIKLAKKEGEKYDATTKLIALIKEKM